MCRVFNPVLEKDNFSVCEPLYAQVRTLFTFFMKTRKIRIEHRTHEMFFVRRKNRTARKFFCRDCRAETFGLTPEEINPLVNVSVREIFRRIEKGTIHSTETEAGQIFVCLASLENSSD